MQLGLILYKNFQKILIEEKFDLKKLNKNIGSKIRKKLLQILS